MRPAARHLFRRTLSPFVLACVLLGTAAIAQPGEQTATGVASAEIVSPLTIASIADLEFGGIAISGAGEGSLTIDPASGAPSYVGLVQIGCSSGPCTPHPAQFRVNGVERRSYRVTLPDQTDAIAADGSGNSLQVHSLTSDSRNLPGVQGYGMLDDSGADELNVGGTLSVPASTPPGRYVARVLVVVNYD